MTLEPATFGHVRWKAAEKDRIMKEEHTLHWRYLSMIGTESMKKLVNIKVEIQGGSNCK